ncbi:YraN family protein [Parafrankia sp. FMc2]|uniref:YraN family protein n=1 Tax=Parafrankia sp. FMc2 TaxID=3233196 RepID=UPI0034D47461
MRVSQRFGRFGEDVAARHLSAEGAEILVRNWRCREGEIDIVARQGDLLLFCEVKARSGTGYGSGPEAVTGRKAARIRRLAVRWLAEHPQPPAIVRFDVLSVCREQQGAVRVDHLRGAF